MKYYVLALFFSIICFNSFSQEIYQENPTSESGIQKGKMIELYIKNNDIKNAYLVAKAAYTENPHIFYFAEKYVYVSYILQKIPEISSLSKKILNTPWATDKTYIVSGWVKDQQRKNFEAFEIFKKGNQLFPNSDYLLSEWAVHDEKYDDFKSALIHIESALNINKSIPDYWATLIDIYRRQNKYFWAMLYTDQYCCRFPFEKNIARKKMDYYYYFEKLFDKNNDPFSEKKLGNEALGNDLQNIFAKYSLPLNYDKFSFINLEILNSLHKHALSNNNTWINNFINYKFNILNKGFYNDYELWLAGLQKFNVEYESYISSNAKEYNDFFEILKYNPLN